MWSDLIYLLKFGSMSIAYHSIANHVTRQSMSQFCEKCNFYQKKSRFKFHFCSIFIAWIFDFCKMVFKSSVKSFDHLKYIFNWCVFSFEIWFYRVFIIKIKYLENIIHYKYNIYNMWSVFHSRSSLLARWQTAWNCNKIVLRHIYSTSFFC